MIETGTHVIRLAIADDIDNIIKYIADEWNPKHIYVESRNFFEYEFLMDDHVNSLLAINKNNGDIDAIWLFYQYSKQLRGSDLFGGIWSSRQGCKVPFLAQTLLRYYKELTGGNSRNGVGINPNTTKAVLRFEKGQHIGKLEHYYRLANKERYYIADIKDKKILPAKEPSGAMILLESFDDIQKHFDCSSFKNKKPYKDAWYIEKRYFNHPVYHYLTYGIKRDNKVASLLFCREIDYNGTKILRVIDLIGDVSVLCLISGDLKNIIEHNNYEYIDFYQYGIPQETMAEAGFIKSEENSSNIIPNYFEPFERKNVDLWFHTTFTDEYIVCKGDGDQDRPSGI